jgi:exopolysaccharide biosynthesis polyprenyl glycosylphosphotransferase
VTGWSRADQSAIGHPALRRPRADVDQETSAREVTETMAPGGRAGAAAELAGPVPAVPSDQRVSADAPYAPWPREGWRWMLRNRIAPFLFTLDLLAWAIGSSIAEERAELEIALLLVLMAFLGHGGAYRSRLTLSILADGPRLLARILLAAATVVGLDLLLRPGQETQPGLLLAGVIVAVLVVALRAIGYAVVRHVRAKGLVCHRTLLLGAGRVGTQVAQTLQQHPEYGLDPIGFLDSRPLVTGDELPAPVLGGDDCLAATIAKYDVDTVVIAFGGAKEDRLVEVIRTCDRLECEIFFVPRLFEVHAVSQDMDHVWGLPLIRQRRAAFRTLSWRVKRLVDIVLSATALLLLAPLLGVLALAVRLELGRGIIFRQTRVGMDQRPFELLKFRSLRPRDDLESATRWSIADDDRVGPVGRLLRASSLDELPQLWNILRGDMSLVGPRPERPHFVDTFASTLPRYIARHRVPAGLTGWAQVHGLRGDTSIADRARFDNYYIENWSLGLDLRILIMTMASVVRRRGA